MKKFIKSERPHGIPSARLRKSQPAWLVLSPEDRIFSLPTVYLADSNECDSNYRNKNGSDEQRTSA